MSQPTDQTSSTQPFSPQLMGLIRCPVTHSDLQVAPIELLDNLNQKIADGRIVDRIGQTVQEILESGLVNKDNTLILPIRGGIVVLISDQAISLDQ